MQLTLQWSLTRLGWLRESMVCWLFVGRLHTTAALQFCNTHCLQGILGIMVTAVIVWYLRLNAKNLILWDGYRFSSLPIKAVMFYVLWLDYVMCRLESGTNWTTVYNGSDTEWVISDDKLNYHDSYVFAVAAKNKIGWGPFSNDSLSFIYTPRE